MPRNLSFPFVALGLLLVCTGPAAAQAQSEGERTLRGVVWMPPGSLADAVDDILLMRSIGVDALRVPAEPRDRLLTLTDSLGIAVFQDLGPRFVPARRLVEQQTELERRLSDVVERSAGHPSAVHFGLGEGLDTSDPRTCAVLERLSAVVRGRLPLAKTYYVTQFLDDDKCASAVDFRLADAYLSDQIVAARLEGLPAIGFDGVGVGALAHGRGLRAGVGLLRPRSAESQARFLENALSLLLDESRGVRPAVFVYRWRDHARSGEVGGLVPNRYGLIDSVGTHFPAYRVVSGFYSGSETAFAFPAGNPVSSGSTWLVLLCWIAIGSIAATYAASPTFRQVVARYFRAHGFYREAIVEGRDVLPFVNLVVLISVSTLAGLFVTSVVLAIADTRIATVVAYWMPGPVRSFASVLVASPWLLILFVGCSHALLHTIWTSALSIASRAGRILLPAQTLMIVVWPLWPLLVWGTVGAILPSIDPTARRTVIGFVLAGFALSYAVAAMRTTLDFRSVSRVPWYVAGPLAALSPIGVAIVMRIAMAFSDGPELSYLWHLLLRH